MVGQEQSEVSQAGERERGNQSEQHRRGVHPDRGGSGPGPRLSGVRTLLLQVQAQAGIQELRVAKSHSKANICQDENGARKQNGVSNGGMAPSEDSQVTPSVERKNGSSLNIFNRQKRGVTFNLGDSL